MKLVLASASKNRHDLLNLVGLKHKVIPSKIIESEITDKDSRKRIIKVAKAKVEHVAGKEKNALILGADTYILYRNQVLEKPKFKMDALENLKSLSGTSHLMLTGWCIINSRSQKSYTGQTETRVFFRKLDDQTLTNYVNDYDVVNWAAGYSPQDTPAMHFIEKIEGSLTGFMYGLPLEQIMPVLESEGIS